MAAQGMRIQNQKVATRTDLPTVTDRNENPKTRSISRAIAIALNETGANTEIVLLDHRGQEVERIPYQSNQLWSCDLDGDGGEELILLGQTHRFKHFRRRDGVHTKSYLDLVTTAPS